jgi:hypothetical protein
MEWRHTIWHEGKLIYSAVPKVANTSIKSALLKTFKPDSDHKRVHLESQVYDEVKPRQMDKYGDYLHMTCVRSPFERVVSFWAQKIDQPVADDLTPRLQRLGFRPNMSFDETVRLVAQVPDGEADPHFRSQTFVLRHRRRFLPNLVLHLETLGRDWGLLQRLMASRGIELSRLPHRNQSQHDEPEHHYDDATLVDLVLERYAADFEQLGYTPDPAAPPRDGIEAEPEQSSGLRGALQRRRRERDLGALASATTSALAAPSGDRPLVLALGEPLPGLTDVAEVVRAGSGAAGATVLIIDGALDHVPPESFDAVVSVGGPIEPAALVRLVRPGGHLVVDDDVVPALSDGSFRPERAGGGTVVQRLAATTP